MWREICIAFILLGFGPGNRSPHVELGVIRIVDVWVNTAETVPGKTVVANDCIVIYPGGNFHLERRKQIAGQAISSLAVYESTATDDQLRSLEAILTGGAVTSLPEYVPPKFPLSVPDFSLFHAQFTRSGHPVTLGYFYTAEPLSQAIISGVSPSVAKHWRDSKEVLEPLVEWFHDLEKAVPDSAAGKTANLCK